MERITILNRCHRLRGFVYQQAHFSADKNSIEVPYDRARVRSQSARAAICRRPITFPGATNASRDEFVALTVYAIKCWKKVARELAQSRAPSPRPPA
jgi:hypothetical protein